MINSSTMRPTVGQCRAGIRSAAVTSQRTSLGLLARHIRPLYRPSQKWIDQRKPIRPQLTALIPYRNESSLPPAASEHAPPVTPVPYADLTIGVVRETYPSEKTRYKRVLVERGAGAAAQFPDAAYEKAGATLGEVKTVWVESDILLKVRAPSFEGSVSEVDRLREGATLVSFLYPAQNGALVEKLASRGTTALAMDMIPRISRAQVFDALSSMANLAGYKAVLLAADHFGRMMTAQTTAAGKIPPCKVLVIGAGVAGLSAIGQAKRMGAIVRGFDTRSAAREQVQSLGGEFIEVEIEEDGSGGGGYAKVMSKEFIEAEMKLFLEQCREVDIVITTALIPGRPAPKLITEEMISAMKPGSIIVDLAAENGGNCVKTVPGQLVEHNGVKIIGYTDLPSRLATQSSTLYSNNITKFLLSMTPEDKKFGVDLKDEVVRGSIVTYKGAIVPTAPRPAPPPTPARPTQPLPDAAAAALAITPWQKTRAKWQPLQQEWDWLTVWGVAPALHSPLMSVTNAISGMVGVGGFFIMGGGILPHTFPQLLGSLSVLLAFVNVSGGFVITKRMLDMFKRRDDPPEYPWLYAIPGTVFGAGYIAAASTGMAGLVQAGYLASSLLCIGSLSGLASQATARQGNILGILGVSSGILASLAAVGFPPPVLMQFAGVAGFGSIVGLLIGRRITATVLPQTVAALHSVVGLAAVLTSVGSVMAHIGDISMLHLVSGYLGVLIGGVTFTGSIVAFMKLAGRMSSKPIRLPGPRHALNSSLLGLNVATFTTFLAMAPGAPMIAAGCLAGNAVLSFLKGYTTTAAIGGADMPVVITVLNAYSGFALVAEGFMLDNPLLTTVGSLIGVSGSILSYIMCVAMNRSITNVLFGGIAPIANEDYKMEGSITKTNIEETADALATAESVIIVVGYGMAVAKAQFAISEITRMLRNKRVKVRFAIHPVAGRMPGQCNVLLAEADVPYDNEMEKEGLIQYSCPGNGRNQRRLRRHGRTLVIGANDTVNPIALEPGSSIAGMPVLHAWKSKQVIVMKRGMSSGY
ncbi:NAD(P) transhydrogenase, mitochondrial, partial [Lachnellula occidentalis]